MRGRVALVIGVLGLALVALLVEFKRVLQRPRHGEQVTPLAESESQPPAPQPDRSPPPRLLGRSLPTSHRPQTIGVAHFRGRLVRPETAEDSDRLTNLKVVADDGRRTFDASIIPGEASLFEMHIPPGRYSLTAHADGLVGAARDLVLEAGSEHDLLLYLEETVAITGDVRARGASDDDSLFALAFRAGSKIEQGDGTVEDGGFSLEGLRSGETYDLVFGGKRVRTVTLHNVTAPAQGLEIDLAPLPIVRGAIGFARGTACPFTSIEIQKPGAPPAGAVASDDSGESENNLEADCRFELPIPEDAPAVMVVARGRGWFTEALVVVPPIGDPDPICLNPPCRADPLEGSADLFVSVDLPAERAAHAYIHAAAGGQMCEGPGTSCEIHGLPTGAPVTVDVLARGAECDAARTATLAAGINSVTVACGDRAQPQPEMMARRIQGVLHTGAGDAVDRIAIRCNGAGSERNLFGTHVFSIVCPRDASTLEYQITDGGPWTAVSIPNRPDLALVEIAVGHI